MHMFCSYLCAVKRKIVPYYYIIHYISSTKKLEVEIFMLNIVILTKISMLQHLTTSTVC